MCPGLTGSHASSNTDPAGSETREVLALIGVFAHVLPLVWSFLPPDCGWLVPLKLKYHSPGGLSQPFYLK